MKTKNAIQAKIATLTLEINDLEAQDAAAMKTSDWDTCNCLRSVISLKIGMKIAYEDSLFEISFHNEIA